MQFSRVWYTLFFLLHFMLSYMNSHLGSWSSKLNILSVRSLLLSHMVLQGNFQLSLRIALTELKIQAKKISFSFSQLLSTLNQGSATWTQLICSWLAHFFNSSGTKVNFNTKVMALHSCSDWGLETLFLGTSHNLNFSFCSWDRHSVYISAKTNTAPNMSSLFFWHSFLNSVLLPVSCQKVGKKRNLYLDKLYCVRYLQWSHLL